MSEPLSAFAQKWTNRHPGWLSPIDVFEDEFTELLRLRTKVGQLQSILIDNIHDVRTALHGSSSALPVTPKEAHEMTVREVEELRLEVERLRHTQPLRTQAEMGWTR
ncbi:MAG TPA: hypothetical protein VMZ51_08060 [Acidimicrobiales bacterium]|nr:hypothetical protein [Acidimicrobiales bacterium]